MTFEKTTPVIQASNVAKSVRWYREVLGFEGWTFPEGESHSFALLCRDTCELMFQVSHETPVRQGWAAHIRVSGSQLLDLAEHVRSRVPLSREPERMPYGDVEFSVRDPDGHEIVLSERLDDEIAVPMAKEG